MNRWLAIAISILLLACKPPPPELATAHIQISLAVAGQSSASKVIDELQRLGFKEERNPSSKPHFRIYSIRVPEEYLVGVSLEQDEQSSQQTIFFSGPKHFSEAGVGLYRNLLASLRARIGENYVSSSTASDAGQKLIQDSQP
jgi:hypothetical protein